MYYWIAFKLHNNILYHIGDNIPTIFGAVFNFEFTILSHFEVSITVGLPTHGTTCYEIVDSMGHNLTLWAYTSSILNYMNFDKLTPMGMTLI